MTRYSWMLAAWIAVLPVEAADKPEELPWKVNPPRVMVKKELYRKSPKPKAAALAWEMYVGPKLERLEWNAIEVLDDVWDENRSRWSLDNGRTWSEWLPQATLP